MAHGTWSDCCLGLKKVGSVLLYTVVTPPVLLQTKLTQEYIECSFAAGMEE